MAGLSDDVLFAGIRELSERLRKRELSPVELTEAYLARAADLGGELRSWATLTRDLALAQARRAADEIGGGAWRGPLHGIPYAAKDLLAVRWYPTTWGAAPLLHQKFADDATVIQRLADAGAVLLGKAAMIELAGGFGYRYPSASATGAALNPWDRRRWTCGSSSGSGAIVASGQAAFAIGSETWGSILCPSAHCGVTGLRPTYGRVSRHGAMPLSYSLDKLGPLARSADDCAIVLHVLAGHDPADESSLPQAEAAFDWPLTPDKQRKTLRIGWVAAQGKGGTPGVEAACRNAVELLRKSGCSVEAVTLPDGPWTAATEVILCADFETALRVRLLAQKKMSALFQQFDVLAGPARGETAFAVDANLEQADDVPDPLGCLGNLCGLPAISVPCGFVGGLPVGVQFVGRALDDHAVVFAGMLLQQKSDWHKKRPPEAPATTGE